MRVRNRGAGQEKCGRGKARHHAGKGRGTLVEITWTPVDATHEEIQTFNAHHDSMRNGWGGTLDKLAAYLKS